MKDFNNMEKTLFGEVRKFQFFKDMHRLPSQQASLCLNVNLHMNRERQLVPYMNRMMCDCTTSYTSLYLKHGTLNRHSLCNCICRFLQRIH